MSDTLTSRLRRTGLILGAVLGLLAAFGVLVWRLLVSSLPSDTILLGVTVGGGAVLVAMVLLMLVAMPRHSWHLTDRGIEVSQTLSLPFWPEHHVSLRWDRLAGLGWSTAGVVRVLDLTTTDGARYRLAPPGDGSGRADDAALAAFAERIRARAAASGRPLGPPGETLGDLERMPGLILLTLGFVLSVVLASLVIWALLASEDRPSGYRAGYGAAFIILLPVGAGWLLLRSLRRRRRLRAR